MCVYVCVCARVRVCTRGMCARISSIICNEHQGDDVDIMISESITLHHSLRLKSYFSSHSICISVCVCVCVCACVRTCMSVCVRTYMCACMGGGTHVCLPVSCLALRLFLICSSRAQDRDMVTGEHSIVTEEVRLFEEDPTTEQQFVPKFVPEILPEMPTLPVEPNYPAVTEEVKKEVRRRFLCVCVCVCVCVCLCACVCVCVHAHVCIGRGEHH